MISGGIAEALVTTALGMLVAVPAVWAFNYFTTQLEIFDMEMQSSADAISTYLGGFRAALRAPLHAGLAAPSELPLPNTTDASGVGEGEQRS